MELVIIIFLLILIVFIVCLLLSKSKEFRERVPVAIAVIAVIISLVSAFKDTIFPFNLEVITDQVIIARPTAPSHNSLPLVVPLTFINHGNGSGIIEAISIKIETQKSVKIYTPVAEVNFGNFIAGKRALHADNIIGAFDPFPISGKSSIKKHILFAQEENSKKYPFNIWNPDKYTFQIFIKESRNDKPKEYISMSHEITKDILDAYKKGTSTVLSSSKELDI